MIDINALIEDIHKNAVDHGWWETDREFPEIVALCHSELSEALEAYREDQPLAWDNNGKPDGIAVEMIDCVIRIFDWFGTIPVDFETLLLEKHNFNKTRPYKHGNKKI